MEHSRGGAHSRRTGAPWSRSPKLVNHPNYFGATPTRPGPDYSSGLLGPPALSVAGALRKTSPEGAVPNHGEARPHSVQTMR